MAEPFPPARASQDTALPVELCPHTHEVLACTEEGSGFGLGAVASRPPPKAHEISEQHMGHSGGWGSVWFHQHPGCGTWAALTARTPSSAQDSVLGLPVEGSNWPGAQGEICTHKVAVPSLTGLMLPPPTSLSLGKSPFTCKQHWWRTWVLATGQEDGPRQPRKMQLVLWKIN
jgi:hypothetical protein